MSLSGETDSREPDFWVAYYGDGSEFVVFLTEIEALRYAVVNTMSVGKGLCGLGLRETLVAR